MKIECELCGIAVEDHSYLIECGLCGRIFRVCKKCEELNGLLMACPECEEGECPEEGVTFGRLE